MTKTKQINESTPAVNGKVIFKSAMNKIHKITSTTNRKIMFQLIIGLSIIIVTTCLFVIKYIINYIYLFSLKCSARCLDFNEKYSEENSRRRIIMDRKNEEPYLVRYYLFLTDRDKFPFNIFIHKFLKGDDDEDVHDHPWGFFHLILSGGYWEEVAINNNLHEGTKKIWRKPGYWNVADSSYKHRIELGNEKPWTIFIPFKKRNEWGFWVNKSTDENTTLKTIKSWSKIPHSEYLKEKEQKRSSPRLKECSKKNE